MIEEVSAAVVASMMYSITFFIKKREKDNREQFDIRRMAATVVVGTGIGVGSALSGSQITEYATFEEQMAMYAGAVAVVESTLKIGYRYIKRKTA